ncbi:outer membrane lipid asymmetry maintenance protein MlaD [Candidatus Binatus sp.]|uniref:outer membrane lipid asymmetry maintenance protein MlaD n=1 Tax=Candidatus Binatus sp. TaxID=2811406 RepID=UPI003C5FE05B
MYASRTTQFIVGIFALLGIAALAILSLSLGKLSLLPTPGYTLYASFDNISGLKTGDQVQLDGVQIGKVTHIGLKDMRARVALRVNEGVEIDQDAIAAIKTSGIIGDKYISIALGPSEKILNNGDTIRQTESAFVLEDAIGQLINNSGSGGGDKDKAKDKSADSATAQKPAKPEK